DEHVGVLLLDRLAEAEFLEHAFDALGVVSVHLAAERRDEISLHSGLNSLGGGRCASGTPVAHTRAEQPDTLDAGRGHGVPLPTVLGSYLGERPRLFCELDRARLADY